MERVHQHTAEQIMDGLEPQVQKQTLVVMLEVSQARTSNTELLFRIIHSVNLLSVYGAVSSWCEQVCMTEEGKGQEKQKESVTKGVLKSVKSKEVKLLVSSP